MVGGSDALLRVCATARWYTWLADPQQLGNTGGIGFDERVVVATFRTLDEAMTWMWALDADDTELCTEQLDVGPPASWTELGCDNWERSGGEWQPHGSNS